MNAHEIAACFDLTILRATCTGREINDLTAKARKMGTAAVCIHPINITRASRALAGSNVAVATVIGFPFGAVPTDWKKREAENAVAAGANELDMVMNLGALFENNFSMVQADIEAVVEAGVKVKVIVEACLLSDEQKISAAKVIADTGAHFVKTCTGVGANFADPKDVALLRKHLPASVKIKASGQVNSLVRFQELKKAGADRFGLLPEQADTILKEFFQNQKEGKNV